MRRNEDQQEADQGNQVEVVHVQRLILEENVGVAEKEEDGADAVTETNGYAGRQHSEREEVYIHAIPRPRVYPTKSVVREVVPGIYVVTLDPAVDEVAPYFPNHDHAEGDTEEDERSNVDRREESAEERAMDYRGWFAKPICWDRICRLRLNNTPPAQP